MRQNQILTKVALRRGIHCSRRVCVCVPFAVRSALLSWRVWLAAVASLAIYLHSFFWWTEPRDMSLFQRPWFEHLVHYGPVGAFAHPFSNYTPAYLYLLAVASLFHGAMEAMYLVKLLSVAGTAFAAIAIADLIKTAGGQPKWAVILFVLPSAVINAALLAQCDALWAGACVLAVSTMIRGRTALSLVWCGVAIAFKAQAAFIAPFIIGALIGRRAPLWQWSVPLLTFAALMTPAWLAGWPAWQLAMIYPSQPGWIPFPGRLANPWIVPTMNGWPSADHYYWVGIAAAAVASIAIAALASTAVRKPRAMFLLALLSALALPFFLPRCSNAISSSPICCRSHSRCHTVRVRRSWSRLEFSSRRSCRCGPIFIIITGPTRPWSARSLPRSP